MEVDDWAEDPHHKGHAKEVVHLGPKWGVEWSETTGYVPVETESEEAKTFETRAEQAVGVVVVVCQAQD